MVENRVDTVNYGSASLFYRVPKITNELKRLGFLSVRESKTMFAKRAHAHLRENY